MKSVIKIGHRGASGYIAENTIPSFKRAVALGADMIELDVHICKTSELVVLHDETVDRVTNGSGEVSKMTLLELKKLVVSEDFTIPTLDEVLSEFKGLCRINIEVKDKHAAKETIKIVQKHAAEDTVIITSNYVAPLREVFRSCSHITTGLVFYAAKTNTQQTLYAIIGNMLIPITRFLILRRAYKARVQWVMLHRSFVRKRFVKLLHSFNYKVGAWIINKPSMIKKMRRRGVDAIFSDYPDRL